MEVLRCVWGMNFQNIYWRIESLHQRTLIRILYEFFSQNSAFTFINCYILKIFHRNWIESNIVDTYGYGIPSMDATAAPSLCNSDGTTDIIPTGMSMI